MSSKVIVLCDLSGPGNRKMTTWLDKRDNLKQGVQVTLLPDKDVLWNVDRIYEGPEHTADDFDWHRKWDNNI